MAGDSANTTYRVPSAAASDNAALIVAAPCFVRRMTGYNAAAAVRYIKLYDKAWAPPSGDTPRKTIAIPAAPPFSFDWDDYYKFGLGIRMTTGGPDADTGALTAADIVGLNTDYR